MALEGGSWTGVFLGGNAAGRRGGWGEEEEEKEEKGKKIQSRDAA